MCGRRRRSAPAPMHSPPPIMSRNPDLSQVSNLPTKRELVDDEEDVTTVEYGTSKKSGSQAKATGARQLRIPLNTGSTNVASSGGVTGGTI